MIVHDHAETPSAIALNQASTIAEMRRCPPNRQQASLIVKNGQVLQPPHPCDPRDFWGGEMLEPATSSKAVALPEGSTARLGLGFDPYISVIAAYKQIPRVARARRMSAEQLRALVDARAAQPLFRLSGDPHVNVLDLNFYLDESAVRAQRAP